MVSKKFLIMCGSVLLIQNISAHCIGHGAGLANNFALGAEIASGRLVGAGYGPGTPTAFANGGSFTVTSSSPILPTGITVLSENTIEGPLEVAGELPVLATVEVEGQFPSSGVAGTTFGCGNGQVGISSESLAAAGVGAEPGMEVAGTGIATVSKLSRPCKTIY